MSTDLLSNVGVQTQKTRWTIGSLSVVLLRWVLGGVFIYMGLSKALHPELFLKLVRQYQVISGSMLLNSVAAFLPWFEVFCGLLLLSGIAVRGSALLVLMMLIPFTFIVLRRALAMAATQGLPFCAVKFDCGCGNGEVIICHKLVENGLLMTLAIGLLFTRTRQLCARFSLFAPTAANPA